MPMSSSLFCFQFAGVWVFHPLYVGRISALPFRQTVTADKRGIHISAVGGRVSSRGAGR